MRLRRPPHDFGRICRRILIVLWYAALRTIRRRHLLSFFCPQWTFGLARRDLFHDRVLLLHLPLDDFGRICCRVPILLRCLAVEEHVHLLFRRRRRPTAAVPGGAPNAVHASSEARSVEDARSP